MAEIYYTDIQKDEEGNDWYFINGDTGYNLTAGWTKEEAKADYLSPEGTLEREIETRRAWGFYD